jgi:hypothetical protein
MDEVKIYKKTSLVYALAEDMRLVDETIVGPIEN